MSEFSVIRARQYLLILDGRPVQAGNGMIYGTELNTKVAQLFTGLSQTIEFTGNALFRGDSIRVGKGNSTINIATIAGNGYTHPISSSAFHILTLTDSNFLKPTDPQPIRKILGIMSDASLLNTVLSSERPFIHLGYGDCTMDIGPAIK